MTYAIIQVFEYKGGELSEDVNLSKDDFLAYLSETCFEGIDFDFEQENPPIEDLKVILKHKIQHRDFFSTYAGGDGFCGKIYSVSGSKMKELKFIDFVDDLAEWMIKNWA